MAKLIAFNLTGSPLALAAGNPAPILPASDSPPERGEAVNVWAELNQLPPLEYAAVQAQVDAGLVEFEWEGDPDWPTPGLTTAYAGTNPVVRITHADSPYDATYGVIIADSTGGPIIINAPSASAPRGEFTVQDGGLTASTNSIQVVAEPGDWVGNALIDRDGDARTWVSDGDVSWSAISDFAKRAIDAVATITEGGITSMAISDDETQSLLFQINQVLELILLRVEVE